MGGLVAQGPAHTRRFSDSRLCKRLEDKPRPLQCGKAIRYVGLHDMVETRRINAYQLCAVPSLCVC